MTDEDIKEFLVAAPTVSSTMPMSVTPPMDGEAQPPGGGSGTTPNSDGPNDDDIKAFLGAPAQPQQPQTSTMEDVARSAASGIVRGLPTAIDVPAAALATGIEKMTGSKGSMADLFRQNLGNGLNAGVSKVAGEEYQPQTEAGVIAKGAGAAVGSLPLGGTAALTEGVPMALGRAALAGVGGVAGGQAGGAIGQAVGGDTGEVIGSVVGGIAGGVGGAKLPGAPKALGNALTPKVDPKVAPLAARAQELGVPLSINQVVPGKVVDTAQKVSQVLPFSGVKAFEDTQRAKWNEAVAKTLGDDVKDLSPESIQKFTERNGGDFDRILKDKPVNVGAEQLAGVEDIATQAGKYLDSNLAKVVQNSVDELKSNIGPNGVIDGSKLASFRSQLIKGAQNAQGGAKEYLGDLASEVDNIAQKGLSVEDAQALGQVRRQYRNLMTIKPLLEKSTTGEINPTELNSKVASSKYINASKSAVGDDDLVDLARIGKQFMAKLGGSDTYDKATLAGGTVGAFASPILAAKGAAVIAANRGLQKLNQSQSLVSKAIRKANGAPNPSAKPSAVEVIADGPKVTRSALRDAPDPRSKPYRIDIGKRGSK